MCIYIYIYIYIYIMPSALTSSAVRAPSSRRSDQQGWLASPVAPVQWLFDSQKIMFQWLFSKVAEVAYRLIALLVPGKL